MSTESFTGFAFHRILSTPRRPPKGEPDPVPAQLLAALVGAHAELSTELDPGPGTGPGAGAVRIGPPGPATWAAGHPAGRTAGHPARLPQTAHGGPATPAGGGPDQAAPAIAVGWVRAPGSPHVHVLVGGRPFFPAAGRTDGPGTGGPGTAGRESAGAAVLFPPGSTGVAVPTADVLALLAALPWWVPCTGRYDPLWVERRDGAADSAPRRGSFDDYAAHLDGPFAWLVRARPVPDREVAEERAALTRAIPALRRRENDEDARTELERATARHRELTRFAAAGMWDVEIMVGGTTPARARGLAALLCGSSDLDRLPYTLLPAGPAVPFAGLGACAAPFRAGVDLLAAIARPPARELPGITVTSPNMFDVSPEGAGQAGSVVLGRVLDAAWSPVDEFRVPRATLNRHAFVCGATGSGKSQTVRSLLESLARHPRPVPWLVLEPAKAEYARMAGRLDGHADVLVIRPGRLDAPPASLNPLEPEPGFPLQSHIDLVRALFLAAFEAHEPFPQVLARALTACYREAGWNLVLDRPDPPHRPRFRVAGPAAEPLVPVRRRYPTLGDLQRTAARVVETIGYGAEVTADVRGFVDVRIGSLREGTPGRFFEGGHPLDVGALLERNVVVELEDITNDQDKAFLLGAVLIRVVEHLRVRHGAAGAGGLRHVLVIEEAHRLLRGAAEGPAAAAVELFASLLAEIRAYGEGVVVVEQIPAKILPDVIKNTALKVVHRLPAADDRAAVGGTMNLREEQSEQVVAFPPGVAAVTVDGMDRPVAVRMTPGDDRESAAAARYDTVPLAGRRSLLCGPACTAGSACTLEQTETAAVRSRDPRLVVWVEALAAHQVIGLAHLLGHPPPRPGPELTRFLRELASGSGGGTDRRTLDCVLAHAVDRAVDARRRLLAPWVDPDDFADRLAQVARRLAGNAVAPAEGAGPDEPDGSDSRRWTAGFYRWQDVRRALIAASRRPGMADGPHPFTEEWRERGLELPDAPVAEQLAWLKSGPIYAEGQDAVSVGDAAASGLADAVRTLTGGVNADCLLRALRQVCDTPGLPDLVDQISDLVEAAGRPAPTTSSASGEATDARR